MKQCQMCGTGERLCVDHCHTRKVVRGMLCDSCNRMVGSHENETPYAPSPIHPRYGLVRRYLETWETQLLSLSMTA